MPVRFGTREWIGVGGLFVTVMGTLLGISRWAHGAYLEHDRDLAVVKAQAIASSAVQAEMQRDIKEILREVATLKGKIDRQAFTEFTWPSP